jgi:hypothetical protein
MERTLSVVLLLAALSVLSGPALAALPSEIPVAAVFDEEGDPKLQLAFVHGIDRINQAPIRKENRGANPTTLEFTAL